MGPATCDWLTDGGFGHDVIKGEVLFIGILRLMIQSGFEGSLPFLHVRIFERHGPRLQSESWPDGITYSCETGENPGHSVSALAPCLDGLDRLRIVLSHSFSLVTSLRAGSFLGWYPQ